MSNLLFLLIGLGIWFLIALVIVSLFGKCCDTIRTRSRTKLEDGDFSHERCPRCGMPTTEKHKNCVEAL